MVQVHNEYILCYGYISSPHGMEENQEGTLISLQHHKHTVS